jgi:hypothetical protein
METNVQKKNEWHDFNFVWLYVELVLLEINVSSYLV